MLTKAQVDELIDNVYDAAVESISDETITTGEVIAVAMQVMIFVQALRPAPTGAVKKAIVVAVVKKLAEEHIQFGSKSDKRTVIAFIDGMLPTMIDVTIDAYKRNIDLSKDGKNKQGGGLCCFN